MLPSTTADIAMKPITDLTVETNNQTGSGSTREARSSKIEIPGFSSSTREGLAYKADSNANEVEEEAPAAAEEGLNKEESSDTLTVYHSEGAKRASRRFRFLQIFCRCLFPEELFHKVEQNLHGFSKHTENLSAGETLIHHYRPEDFRSKYTERRSIVDEKGNKIEMKDTKDPTEEEMRLYQLRAVVDTQTVFSQLSSESGQPIESSGGGRRRLTFSRSDSQGLNDLVDGMDYSGSSASGVSKSAMKQKRSILKGPNQPAKEHSKSVRVFPIVRVTMIDNFANNEVEDWDVLHDCECMRPMERGDLWYTKKDIVEFKQLLRHEDEEFSLFNLRRQSKNSLIWFQTFGKFFGECGDQFTEDHETTIFGKPIADCLDFDDVFYDETLELIAESGPPVEYKKWASGSYFLQMPEHSTLVFSNDDVVPSHETFNSLSIGKGVKNSVTTRLRKISERDHSFSDTMSQMSVYSDEDDEDANEDSGINGIIRDYDDSSNDPEYHQAIVRRSSSVVNMSLGGIQAQASLQKIAAKLAEKEEAPKKPWPTPKTASRKASSIDKFLNLEDDVDTKSIGGEYSDITPKTPDSAKMRARKFKYRNQSLKNLLSEESKKTGGSTRRVIEVKMDSGGGALKIMDPSIKVFDSSVGSPETNSSKKPLLKMLSSGDIVPGTQSNVGGHYKKRATIR